MLARGASNMAGKVVHIKNHISVVVTQEDVDDYGSVESAVNGRVVEAESFATN